MSEDDKQTPRRERHSTNFFDLAKELVKYELAPAPVLNLLIGKGEITPPEELMSLICGALAQKMGLSFVLVGVRTDNTVFMRGGGVCAIQPDAENAVVKDLLQFALHAISKGTPMPGPTAPPKQN
jgi:hypothetical protein